MKKEKNYSFSGQLGHASEESEKYIESGKLQEKHPRYASNVHLKAIRKRRQKNNINKFIIHIPHSSTYLPKDFYNRLLVDKEYIDKENIFISDFYVDYFVPEKFNNIVKFEYSRLMCDVERYKIDRLEEMSKYGMGVVYEKDSNNNKFIDINKKYKKEIIKKYYDTHHNNLNNMIEKVLDEYDSCYIIDLHSFSDKFVNKVFNKTNNPDICIGIDKEYYSKELTNLTINHFKEYGYSVKVNYPYSGTMTPNKKDNRVKSIMIEINKRIYLDKNFKSNEDIILSLKKSYKLKKCFDDYYKKIKRGLYK